MKLGYTNELSKLINELTATEFNNWVMSWLDTEMILDTINNWDTDLKKETIAELKKIIANRKL